MGTKYESIDTKLIHSGEPEPRIDGAVSLPVFQTAMYETHGGEGYHNVRYIRLNNTPNHVALAGKLSAIENAEDAIVTASGMAAISAALLAVVSSGDHLLIQNSLYGGTHALVVNDFPKWGIEYDLVDPNDPGDWEKKIKPNTKAFYMEAISNPTIQISDIPAFVDFSKAHKLVTLIDNTFPSPINFRPAEHGIDLSLHSCTKYMNGHSDIVAGAIIGNTDLVQKAKLKLDHLGGTLDPHACFLLHRGLKTLALRVRYQNDSALEIAQFLEGHQAIKKVNYPGLPNHPQHEMASKLFDGFGGMLSYELNGDLSAVDRFMRAACIPIIAPSLGGVESLLTRPAVTSHASLSKTELENAGISPALVRMSVGIESVDDIIKDLDQALAA